MSEMSPRPVGTAQPTPVARAGALDRAPQGPVPGEPSGQDTRLGASARTVAWLLALGCAVWALLSIDTPALDIARYGAYLAVGLVLPGWLLLRTLTPSRLPLAEELAVGAAVGIGVELAALAALAQVGWQRWTWAWAAVAVAVLLLPGARRRRAAAGPVPRQHPGWSCLTAAVLGLAVVVLARTSLGPFRLPPAGTAYYVDLSWHNAIVHALERAVPPAVPQVAGETLEYHWFSHAQMAAAAMASGVDEATVLLRLWPTATTVLAGLAAAALARRCGGPPWVPPLAAGLLVLSGGVRLLPTGGGASTLSVLSPSQNLAVVLVLAAAWLGSTVVSGPRMRIGTAVAAAVVMLTSSGAKPTTVPLLLAGFGFAALVLAALRDRRWRPTAAIAVGLAVLVPASRGVSGSDTGVSIRFLSFGERLPLYRLTTGAQSPPVVGPLLPEGIADLSSRSVLVALLLLTVAAVPMAGSLVPLLALPAWRRSADPAVWVCAGAVVAGFAVYLVLSHPALSQGYFRMLGTAFGAVLGAWAVGAAAQGIHGTTARRVSVLVGVLLGAATVIVATRVGDAPPPGLAGSVRAWLRAIGAPLGLAATVVLLVLLVVAVLRSTGRVRAPVAPAILLAAVVVGAQLPGPASTARLAVEGLVRDATVAENRFTPLAPGAAEALAWVEANTPRDAVLASNRQCAAGPDRPGCSASAFGVSGWGGRQVVLEGWRYAGPTPTSVATPWPERLAQNEAVFERADAAALERLRAQFGVTWLVADRTAGPVSPRITTLAEPRFRAGALTVYEVR